MTVVTQLNLYLSTIFFWGFFVYVGCPNEFWMGYRAMLTHRMSEKLSLVKSEVIQNLDFRAKNWWIIVIMIHWLLLEFEFWRQKLFNFNNFQLLLFLCVHKITIFGAKIQIIIKATLAFKNSQKVKFFWNWIFGHNLRFECVSTTCWNTL